MQITFIALLLLPVMGIAANPVQVQSNDLSARASQLYKRGVRI